MRGVTVLKLAAGKAVFQISFTLKNLTGIWPGRKFSIALAYSIDGQAPRSAVGGLQIGLVERTEFIYVHGVSPYSLWVFCKFWTICRPFHKFGIVDRFIITDERYFAFFSSFL